MKSFIVQSSIFGLVLALSFLMFEKITSSIIRSEADFKLPLKPEIVIFGDSHTECAFNDSLIANSKNFSQSGEFFVFTYQKVKLIVQQNPEVNTILVGFVNNQIVENRDDWFFGDSYLLHIYPIYSPFMDISDKELLLTKNFNGFLNVGSVSTKDRIIWLIKNDFSYIPEMGGYNHVVGSKIDSLVADRNVNSWFDANDPISEENLLYLDKIVAFCNSEGKDLYFVRTPLHPEYGGYENEILFKKILRDRYAEIEFLDFGQLPIKNSEFRDLDHLNNYGARSFSLFFQRLLNDGLLMRSDKQEFIEIEIFKLGTKSYK